MQIISHPNNSPLSKTPENSDGNNLGVTANVPEQTQANEFDESETTNTIINTQREGFRVQLRKSEIQNRLNQKRQISGKLGSSSANCGDFDKQIFELYRTILEKNEFEHSNLQDILQKISSYSLNSQTFDNEYLIPSKTISNLIQFSTNEHRKNMRCRVNAIQFALQLIHNASLDENVCQQVFERNELIELIQLLDDSSLSTITIYLGKILTNFSACKNYQIRILMINHSLIKILNAQISSTRVPSGFLLQVASIVANFSFLPQYTALEYEEESFLHQYQELPVLIINTLKFYQPGRSFSLAHHSQQEEIPILSELGLSYCIQAIDNYVNELNQDGTDALISTELALFLRICEIATIPGTGISEQLKDARISACNFIDKMCNVSYEIGKKLIQDAGILQTIHQLVLSSDQLVKAKGYEILGTLISSDPIGPQIVGRVLRFKCNSKLIFVDNMISELQKNDFATCKQILFALKQIFSIGKYEDCAILAEKQLIPALIGFLDCKGSYVNIIIFALETIENILEKGDQSGNEENPWKIKLMNCNGHLKIAETQNHTDEEIYQISYRIIDTYSL